MSESNDEQPVTFSTKATTAGAMMVSMSGLDGTYLWMAVTPEMWEEIKRDGDENMSLTIQLSPS